MAIQKLTCEAVDLVQHTCQPCDETEGGRIRSIILGKYSAFANVAAFETAVSTAAAIQEAIAAGSLVIIPRTSGTASSEPNTGEGYGDEDERLLGYTRTIEYQDPAYKDNGDFYEAAETAPWYLAYRTESLLHVAQATARLRATDPVDADLTSNVTWNGTLTYKTKKKDKLVDIDEAGVREYITGCYKEQA